MIKLTIITTASTVQKSFTQNRILIGGGSAPSIDLPLPVAFLQSSHLEIYEDLGAYYLKNQANDPFVILNGLPFGKKKLKEGDCIQLYDIEIRVEQIAQQLAPLLEKKIQTAGRSHQWMQEELDDEEIESLIQQVESLESYEEFLDEEEAALEEHALLPSHKDEPAEKPKKSRLTKLLLLAIVALASLIGALFYLSLNEEKDFIGSKKQKPIRLPTFVLPGVHEEQFSTIRVQGPIDKLD